MGAILHFTGPYCFVVINYQQKKSQKINKTVYMIDIIS